LRRDEAKRIIGKWLGEASDEIESDRLETMLREVSAQVHTGVSGANTYDTLISALELEIAARLRGGSTAFGA